MPVSESTPSPDVVTLRPVHLDDLPIIFQQEQDPEACWMAAFTADDPNDHAAFMEHWNRVLNNDSLIKQTILWNDQVAGHIVSFEQFGHPSIGYWLGKAFWGKGIATRAVALFVQQISVRPLYARAAADNAGSIRVLEKCGFVQVDTDRGFASARGAEIEEVVMKLTN